MKYRGYSIDYDPIFSMKVINPVGKGSVSKELRGMYSNVKEARIGIDRFISDKEIKDGKIKHRSRSKQI